MNDETAIQSIQHEDELLAQSKQQQSSSSTPSGSSSGHTFKFMLVGALAGLFSDAVVHPIDTIRTNTILRSTNATSTLSGSISTASTSNNTFKYSLRSLYRGFSVVSIFTIPAHASYFVSYEKSKEYLLPIIGNDNLTFLASGLIADIFGGLFWCPMDVMKQRFQYHQKLTFKDLFSNNNGSTTISNNNPIRNAIHLIYKGFGTSIVVYGPYVSLYFMLYENFKKLHLKHTNPDTTPLSLPYYMLYASCASTISAIVTTPLDVIKTRVQTLDVYKSPLDVLRRENPLTHFSSYMTGWKPRALWMASGTALTMVFYEEFKKHLLVNNSTSQ